MTERLAVQDAVCCTTWTVIVGVGMGECGICGAVPDRQPDTVRVVEYERDQGYRLVASVNEEGEWEQA